MKNLNFHINIREISNGFLVSGNLQKVSDAEHNEIYVKTESEATKLAKDAFDKEMEDTFAKK